MTTEVKVGMNEQSKAVVVSAQVKSDELTDEEIVKRTEDLYSKMKDAAFRHAAQK